MLIQNRSLKLLVLLLLAGFLWTCKEDEKKPEKEPTPPEVTITSPVDQSEKALGEVITISATATDDEGVRFVRFYINNLEVAYLENPPYSYQWDTSEEALGEHIIRAEAVDQDNQTALEQVRVKLAEPKLNVSVSGTLKNRLTQEALSNMTIALENTTVQTNEQGAYQFSNYQTLGPVCTITSEVGSGYIPFSYGFDLMDDAELTIPLYAYPTPQNVNPKPDDFIKGISLFDAGPWMGEDLYPDAFESTFARLNSMKVNAATVFDPVFVTVVGTDSVKMSTQAATTHSWDMLSYSQYTNLTEKANAQGLDLIYWFGVWPQDEEQLDGKSFNELVFSGTTLSDEFWNDWFSEYTRVLTDYAAVAQTNNVPYISLGHGLNYATSPALFSSEARYHELWTKLIADLRAVFSGEILYFGTARPFEAPNYHGGREVAYFEDSGYTKTFINLFDAFGLVISNNTETVNPTPSQVKEAVATTLNRYADFDKPIILWIWAPSADGAANHYGHLEPVLAVGREADNFEKDYYEQADIYQGIMEAVNETSTNVKGILSHGYMYYDQLEKYAPRDMETAFQKSASVRNKPAEKLLQYWFTNW
ncbi:Ig-like domain-containing protein [uncultured Sunxiuqinia sp.]|uniref:Ig-like domain-containing protein n=1 Tax=uncultured Sunxiuqinia sp. TaxID=1573825 RepID=UPI0026041C27|nr:Ig-like domain-containing protein [uncultured Sunxiuqinia sp.]